MPGGRFAAGFGFDVTVSKSHHKQLIKPLGSHPGTGAWCPSSQAPAAGE